MLNNFRLKIAIQKSGKLSKDSKKFLKSFLDIDFKKNSLITFAKNAPVDVFHVRDDDILSLVIDNIVDLGILGENVLQEEYLLRKKKDMLYKYSMVRRLNFGDCRISIAIPFNEKWTNINWLNNKKIATSYPYILKKYLNQFDINFSIFVLNGSVEIAQKINLSDAICDVVSTGKTLKNNNLREVETIYHSKACLIKSNKNFSLQKNNFINNLLFQINSFINVENNKYIIMHVPKSNLKKVIHILPKVKSFDFSKLLYKKNKVIFRMIISENLFWEVLDVLKKLGVTSISIFSIDKLV